MTMRHRMRVGQADDFDEAAFRAALRGEAQRERPVFSPEFHARLMRRLTPEIPTAGASQPLIGRPRTQHTSWRGPLIGGIVAGVVAGCLAAAVFTAVGPLQLGSRGVPEEMPAGGGVRSVAVTLTAADAQQGGVERGTTVIERLPMFDEIDEEVRSGVVLVASSLLGVPDWRSLADFDAVGFLNAEPMR
jgi:hypothetical protein